MRGTLCLLLLAVASWANAQTDDGSGAMFDGGNFSTEAYNKRVQEVLDALYDERKDMGEEEPGYEWEGYDGWYNNPAHPDWGGADMPLERKTPVAYPDGVYEIAGQDRPNVLLISNVTQNGLTGFGTGFGFTRKNSPFHLLWSASGGGDAGCPKTWLHP
jgi:hypothetical protein